MGVFFCLLFVAVLASFRGTVQHGLPLEIGDTVQILEKCEGKCAHAHTHTHTHSHTLGVKQQNSACKESNCFSLEQWSEHTSTPVKYWLHFLFGWNKKNSTKSVWKRLHIKNCAVLYTCTRRPSTTNTHKETHFLCDFLIACARNEQHHACYGWLWMIVFAVVSCAAHRPCFSRLPAHAESVFLLCSLSLSLSFFISMLMSFVFFFFLFLVFFVPCILCPFFFFFFFFISGYHLKSFERSRGHALTHTLPQNKQPSTDACMPPTSGSARRTHTHTHTLAPSHFPSVDGGNAPAPKGISRSSSQSCCQPACHRGDRMLR